MQSEDMRDEYSERGQRHDLTYLKRTCSNFEIRDSQLEYFLEVVLENGKFGRQLDGSAVEHHLPGGHAYIPVDFGLFLLVLGPAVVPKFHLKHKMTVR